MKTKTVFHSYPSWAYLVTRGVLLVGIMSLCLLAPEGRAQTYTILHAFTGGPDGGNPLFAQLVVSSNTLYGTTSTGGSSGKGTVFKLNTDGTSYTVLKNFTGNDGDRPAGGVILSGSTLYGTTEYGGTNGYGTIFKVNTDGSGYTVLKRFTGSDGRWPFGCLLVSGAILYGTTPYGGDFGWGTIFKIDTNGNNYTLLKSFDTSSDAGGVPLAGLAMSGSVLYGTAQQGRYYYGSVFRINTDGSGFMVLRSFTGSDGKNPRSPVVVSGNVLYGTTIWGGNSNNGTLFRVNTNGSSFGVFKDFTGGSDGAVVQAGLILSGSTLYGTTSAGGDYPYGSPDNGHGTIFRYSTDNSTGFIVLKQFTGADGANPCREPALSGTTLFGMTSSGGSNGFGVIYSLSVVPPTIQTPPQSQTVEAGATVDFDTGGGDDPSLKCQWFFNGNAMTGCTNSDLCLSGVQATNVGTYSVIVTNILGAVTSLPAVLNVIPAVEHWPVLGLKVMGDVGSALKVEYTSSLSPAPNWLPLGVVNLANPPQFWFDLTSPLPSQRFYRAWQAEAPSVIPSLTLSGMVPAIMLTGNIGDQLRLDCINQYGPTNAWVTLDTVTLTNTSQLYFDTSAVGQPARLYRVMPVP